MNITIKDRTLRKLVLALGTDASFLRYSNTSLRSADRSQATNSFCDLTLDYLDSSKLDTVYEVLKQEDETSARFVKQMMNILNDPEERTLRCSLSDLPRYLIAYLKKHKAKSTLLFKTDLESRGIAYLPINAEYTPPEARSRTTEGHVTLNLGYNSSNRYKEWHVTFYSSDLNQTLPNLLKSKGLIIPDEEMLSDHKKVMARYEKYRNRQGEQVLARKKATEVGASDYWWTSSEADMTINGKPSKVVIDTLFGDDPQGRNSRWSSTESRVSQYSRIHEKALPVPIHPILCVWSLKHHANYWINVMNLKNYEFEEDIAERLILPDVQRRLISALVTNMDIMKDDEEEEKPVKSKILQAKAQSSIIIASGPPGTGKTLTAEVYAEQIKRPLYEVASGQIGSDPETIELNLGTILSRAIRLNMPVVINEADVFIRKRGTDMQQNAVCAVFLRLMEYHTGLVFLTTNIDDIDDAFRNRAIAEIRYEIPKYKERVALWRLLLREFDCELSKDDIREAARVFPNVVGRDIKNLTRLTRRVCMALNEPLTLKALIENSCFKAIKYDPDAKID